MAYKSKTNFEIPNGDVSLSYKNQDPFFIAFNEYWNNALKAKQNVLVGKRQSVIKAFFELLDCVSNYVFNYEKKSEELEKLLKNYSNMEIDEFRTKINIFWKNLNEDLKAFELLPKPNNIEENEIDAFWKLEGNKKIKEAKKAFSDMLKNYM